MKYANIAKLPICAVDEGFISEEFGLKVMSMKYSDFSRWNPVAAFQTEVLS